MEKISKRPPALSLEPVAVQKVLDEMKKVFPDSQHNPKLLKFPRHLAESFVEYKDKNTLEEMAKVAYSHDVRRMESFRRAVGILDAEKERAKQERIEVLSDVCRGIEKKIKSRKRRRRQVSTADDNALALARWKLKKAKEEDIH